MVEYLELNESAPDVLFVANVLARMPRLNPAIY